MQKYAILFTYKHNSQNFFFILPKNNKIVTISCRRKGKCLPLRQIRPRLPHAVHNRSNKFIHH